MDPRVCAGCREKTTAEIRDLNNYNEHAVPVWYCERCQLATPVKRTDRLLWVNEYHWDPPGFIYGNRASECTTCLGCGTPSMFADSTLLINEVFPFFEGSKPAWTCYNCGFSDKVMKEDGQLWADLFQGWR